MSLSGTTITEPTRSLEEQPEEPGRAPGSFLPKLGIVISLPLLAILFSFVIVNSNFCREYADPTWVRASSDIYTVEDAPCEVVIYGDSTAVTGADPKAIENYTHLKTCNLAQSKGTQVVLGTRSLDWYLAHNPRPRYLILMFAASNLYQSKDWNDSAYIEGAVTLLRHYPKTEFVEALVRHPDLFIGMAHYAYLTAPWNWWKNRSQEGVEAERRPSDRLMNAHMILPTPAFSNCAQAAASDKQFPFHLPDPAYVELLKKRYSASAEHLVLDVAPLPVCETRFEAIKSRLQKADNSLDRYPVTAYNDGYTHFTEVGANKVSLSLAQQIAALQGSTHLAELSPYMHSDSSAKER